MTNHPQREALEAYVLGHHEAIDRDALEAHLGACDECMDEVGHQARLEMLLTAAGREDAFAAVVEPPRRRRWPLVAAAAALVVAGGTAGGTWLSRSDTRTSEVATSILAVTRRVQQRGLPTWASGLRPDDVRCDENDGLTCAASSFGGTLEEAREKASDAAVEEMVHHVLARGGPALRAQFMIYGDARFDAEWRGDPDRVRRIRRAIAGRVSFGVRKGWYWEEYSTSEDHPGTEFVVFVRYAATPDQIDELRARYEPLTVDGAELAHMAPGMRWLIEPGDDIAYFVWLPGRLAALGIRSGDVLLHDQRRNANGLRLMIERGEVRIWRDGRFRSPRP